MSNNVINLTPYINKRQAILDFFKKADAFYEDVIVEALEGDTSAWQMLELEFDKCQSKYGQLYAQNITVNLT